MPRHIYAALIGINAYEQVNPLRGCMQDVLRMDALLMQLSGSGSGFAYKPLFLLAPHKAEAEFVREQLKANHGIAEWLAPGFDNITKKAFQHLQQATDDDVCVFYFSGHGSHMPAPDGIQEADGSKQFETLLPVNARTTGRPIADKEMAFLFHNMLQKKPGVHCLVIMDCCHSGGNSRGPVQNNEVTYREVAPDEFCMDIKNFLGHKEKFFTVANGQLIFPEARLVQLAACRSNERAVDHPMGGMFSRALCNLLAETGMQYSYQHLMRKLAVSIAVQNGQQNPVAYALQKDDLSLAFLGIATHIQPLLWEVCWLGDDKGWCLMAGELQGIEANGKTTVVINDANTTALVSQVKLNYAMLAGKDLKKLDTEKTYQATFTKHASDICVIGIHPFLLKEKTSLQNFKKAATPYALTHFVLEKKGLSPDYLAALTDAGNAFQFALVSPKSEMPMFAPRQNAEQFAADIAAVAQWKKARSLKPLNSAFTPNDFLFEAEIITGQKITGGTLNKATGMKVQLNNDDTVVLPYANGYQPAFRFTIGLRSNAGADFTYVQCLYCDHRFGVTAGYLPADIRRLERGEILRLSFPVNQFRFSAIPVGLGKNHKELGIKEAFHLLKIIVTTNARMDLSMWEQPPLAENESGALRKPAVAARGDYMANELAEGWSAFDFFLHIKA